MIFVQWTCFYIFPMSLLGASSKSKKNKRKSESLLIAGTGMILAGRNHPEIFL